jgi:hypothetical protein
VLRHGPPARVALELARLASGGGVRSRSLAHQRAGRREVAAEAKCRVVQVESDVIVPVKPLRRRRSLPRAHSAAARGVSAGANSREGAGIVRIG